MSTRSVVSESKEMGMPRSLWYRLACVSLCMATMWTISLRTICGADASPSGEGIDFVLLVDVSRSMTKTGKDNPLVKDGSDPERIRWDAAKLVLDLLGPGDQLWICRFNHGCPPIYGDDTDQVTNDNLLLEAKKHDFFKAWQSDFKMGFRGLATARESIGKEIASFNVTDDDVPQTGVGYLDIGKTKIVKALSTVGEQLRLRRSGTAFQPSHRPIHVVVLTDGRDNDAGVYLDQGTGKATLLKELKFFTGGPGEGLGNGVKIPIHCVGLNLKLEKSKENPDGADEARRLLQQISHVSGGAYEEVNDNSDLMELFLCLTKRLRRYWVEEFTYTAGEDRERVESLVTNGLSELGVLTFRHAEQSNPKFAIEPLAENPKLEWSQLNGNQHSTPQPEALRTGKNKSLYQLSYFGRSVNSNGELGSSPFKQFTDPVTLSVTLPPTKTNQRLVLLKGTVKPLFELISPVAGSGFDRYERIRIQVAMLSTEHFYAKDGPEYFRLTARVRPLGSTSPSGGAALDRAFCAADSGQGQQPVSPEVIVLKRTEANNGMILFEGDIPNSSLPSTNGAEDSFEVSVNASGLSEPKHALSRTQQELPPRIFTVKNSLKVKNVEDIELSTDENSDSQEFVVETVKPSRGEFALLMKFTRPKDQEGMELPAECFQVESENQQLITLDGQSRLILKDGRATVRVSLLKESKRLKHGAQYAPGEFEFTSAPGIKMAPLNIQVSLRLDLAKVQFKGVTTEIQAEELEAPSNAMTVVLAPTVRETGSVSPVTVSLQFLGAVESDRTDASEFLESELWLAKDGEKNDDPAQRRRTIQITVGDSKQLADPFRVYLRATGTKTPMKYRCRLKVSGDWIATATQDFVIDKGAAAIEVESTTVRVPIGRGLSREVNIAAWLNGLRGERALVCVEEVRSGEAVLFLRDGEKENGSDFRVECPDSDHNVELFSVQPAEGAEGEPKETPRSNLKFVVSVPDETPYGIYGRDFTVAGANTKPQKIRLEVVVDGLEFDVLVKSDTGSGKIEPQWKPVSEKHLIQLLQTSMKQTLRVRTGLGDTLQEGDIVIDQVDLFQDPSGDVPKLPVRRSKVRLADGNTTALIDIDFPITPNRNEEGLPYTLHLVAVAPFVSEESGEQKDRTERYVKDIHFRFHVRYLHRREVIHVRSLPVRSEQRP